MNIVIPLLDPGARFSAHGTETHKPLVKMRGAPLYAWGTACLPLYASERLIFVAPRAYLEGTDLEKDIRARFSDRGPEVHVVATDLDNDAGDLAHVLEVSSIIDRDEPLLISTLEAVFSTQLLPVLAKARSVDGIVGVFEGDLPSDRGGYVKIDKKNRVVSVAESHRVGPWATTGLYFCGRGKLFVRYAKETQEESKSNGHGLSVARVFGPITDAGAWVMVEKAEGVWPIATPEQVSDFDTQYDGPELKLGDV